ncbi:hypothetical protein TWF106_002918 [Orbilia oligospora]|uniref:F-box domain-containing protein n=1 Tax=Orbilia oligospora TaxID=2813651 RepID=A0A6G1MBN1_ORBOL|nr:hypothetical protein TWF788_004091 [Orbilia oligospora]KAF3223143.1 hypothetical protein TWF679_004339 [Orbilia oligospora]KAF3225037.1 hypothetical protein TWF106_002918 [Orbilia oligospora]KAF3226436.1 hypothetical protein TWF191_004698 [Orbilia oligospora]KAF3252610.1 hypothetical protein TWF192_004412 [Orbilia oligospora]
MEPLETKAVPSTKAQRLLEWIIFAPSPVTSIFQSQLSTIDVIHLSQVCQTWRAYLIPHFLKTPEGKVEWHPLVKTLAVPTLTAQQEKHCFISRGMRGHLYSGGDSNRHHDFANVDSGINLRLFKKNFGNNYLEAITRIYLDGAKIRYSLNEEVKLAWVLKCKNLVVLSLRWCTSIDITSVSRIFLAGEINENDWSNDDEDYEDRVKYSIPPKFHTLKLWGVSGVWSIRNERSRRKKDHEKCDKLMRKYKTDLEWCPGVPHSGDGWRVKRILEAGTHICGICRKTQKAKCLHCDLPNTCERCLVYFCDQCLKLKTVIDDGPYNDHALHEGIRDRELNLPNMLTVLCNSPGRCRWRAKVHYFHPSCVPFTSTLAPDDKRSQRICPGCGVYLCVYGAMLCSTCGAGLICCASPLDDPQSCSNCKKDTG